MFVDFIKRLFTMCREFLQRHIQSQRSNASHCFPDDKTEMSEMPCFDAKNETCELA